MLSAFLEKSGLYVPIRLRDLRVSSRALGVIEFDASGAHWRLPTVTTIFPN